MHGQASHLLSSPVLQSGHEHALCSLSGVCLMSPFPPPPLPSPCPLQRGLAPRMIELLFERIGQAEDAEVQSVPPIGISHARISSVLVSSQPGRHGRDENDYNSLGKS